MTKNYLTYPTKAMNITQNYNDPYSHKPYSSGTPASYPWDEACSGSGKDWFYCPCDQMKIVRIYGVGSSGANTLFLESTGKVVFADGTEDYCSLLIIHPDDDDLRRLKVGQTFKRNEKICMEGTDGPATGNHFHISAGKGRFLDPEWKENSNGKWDINTSGGSYKPEKLFFIDKKFTVNIRNTEGLSFRNLPEEKSYAKGDYRVTDASLLHVRTGPGTNYRKKAYSELTKNARSQTYEKVRYKADGYAMGVEFTVSQVSGSWGKTPSGWVCLDYCTKI